MAPLPLCKTLTGRIEANPRFPDVANQWVPSLTCPGRSSVVRLRHGQEKTPREGFPSRLPNGPQSSPVISRCSRAMTEVQIPSLDLAQLLGAAQLTALPQSAIRLMELAQDPTNGPDEYAVPVESDPGLAGQVLRFVNSSYFGFPREISSVKLAITLVGIRTIKNFALWSAVFSLMPNPQCGPFDLKSLWQDSLRRALFSRALAKSLGVKEAEETFAAALLQDMAIPMLAKQAPEVYTALLHAREDGNVRLSDLEIRHFGWTHAEAGGLMARNWNLPEDSAVLIENHLDVELWASKPQTEAAKLAVAMSSLLPTIGDPAWIESSRFEGLYERITPVGGPTVAAILEQVDVQYGDLAPVLKLAAAPRSLMDAFREATQGGVARCQSVVGQP